MPTTTSLRPPCLFRPSCPSRPSRHDGVRTHASGHGHEYGYGYGQGRGHEYGLGRGAIRVVPALSGPTGTSTGTGGGADTGLIPGASEAGAVAAGGVPPRTPGPIGGRE